MTSDDGPRLPDPPPVDFGLPKLVDIAIRAVAFRAPRLHNFASSLKSRRDAVEFTVWTDGPIPIRALGPALYVGETPVTEVTEVAPNTYRFIAPDRQNLAPEADIRLGWTGQPPRDRARSRFQMRSLEAERRPRDDGAPA